ncbi:MAG: Holliday junction branch migration DNA helicase RuvB, partial [Nitrospina sp.]|nr:Holliday junction branch migration DNA helicase RuvB [Nitrospina sp.]
TKDVAEKSLAMMEIDPFGLDKMDHKLMLTLIENFRGGPVGLESLAASISEEKDTIEDVLEPYLIQSGFIQRAPRGRIATEIAYKHFGITPPKQNQQKRLL